MYIHLYYICIFSYKMFQLVLMCRYLKVHQVWRKPDTDETVVDDTAVMLRKQIKRKNVLYSRKANSLMASLVKPRVTWFSFENVDMFVGHENCRTKTSFIYTVENIETSYIVFFSAIITSTICLLDLS